MNELLITKEQKYFIKVLRDYVHQVLSDPPGEGFDWTQFCHIAEKQDLCGIAYVQCRHQDNLPTQARRLLKRGFLSEAYLSVNTDYEMDQVFRSFDKENIDYLPFKGVIIRHSYPDYELRSMGDRDILIHPSDTEKADHIMQSLDYRRMIDNHAVWTYTRLHLMFEIHNVMFYDPLPNQVDYKSYFDGIWKTAVKRDDSNKFIPDPKMHFLYMIAHTAKHITNNGIGFRAFLDICFYCLNTLEYNTHSVEWEWIKNELIKLKLLKFTEVCFTLCEHWFEMKMPVLTKEAPLIPLNEIEVKMFRDGIFGLTNEDNTAAHTAMEIRRESHRYISTSIRLTLRKIFPPYRDMQLVPWYSWIDGKPWLLPFAWIYRWFYCLFHKARWSISLLLEPIAKKEQIKKRDKYLDYWGL